MPDEEKTNIENNLEQVKSMESANEIPTVNIPPIPPLPQETPPLITTSSINDDFQTKQANQQNLIPPLPTLKPVSEKERIVKPAKIIWGDIFSSGILILATFLIFILIILFFLLKSGLLALPIFANFYNAPKPTRIVIAQPQDWNQFSDSLTKRLQEKSVDNQIPIALDVSEKDFTGLLQGVVHQGLRNPEYKVEIAQVVFLQDEIEMYFYITWKEIFQAQILVKMMPVLHNNGTVMLEVKDAKIGDLPIPGSLSMQMIGYFFERDVGTWKILLDNGYGIQDVTISDTKVRLLIGPLKP